MTAFASSREIAADVQEHRATARQVADAALLRAETFQEKFRAFITLTPEVARRQAEAVDRRLAKGERLPLAGVPFAVKDLFDVAGHPTTYGSRAFDDRVVKKDAECVRRLVAAGAVCLGKANLHECAFGFTGENPHFGDCRNPFDPERIAGGSSSGSAVAVALGICPLAVGSDTGGSIRQPAALCGIVGLKPTYGRVSRAGGLPLSWSMDHVGPMTHTAEDAALALASLSGRDAADESTSRLPLGNLMREIASPPRGMKLGLPRKWFFEALEPDVAAALETAIGDLKRLGCSCVDVELPRLEEVVAAHRAVIFAEAASFHRKNLETRPESYGEAIRPLLYAGLFFPAVDYLAGQRIRRVVRREWAKVLGQVDALVTPTTPVVATKFGEQTASLPGGEKPLVRAYLDLTLPFNFSGHPAMSVPCGMSQAGLPIGMQLVGRPFGEAAILRLAHAYQQTTDWHARRPESAGA